MSATVDPDSLPTGTIAFLMTDIEGSTQLVGRLGDGWPRVLGDHFGVMRAAVAAHDGTWVSSEGDSVFAVFPSVRQALAAAVDAQRRLAAHEWPPGVEIKVRMGVHAGEAVLGGRDYTGIDVHRTARLMAAGHGAQVLVSEAAQGLAGGSSGEKWSYRDLGVHQLRDLPAPERIFQLTAPGLAGDFAPLRTQRPATPTNLPAPLTRFVGRRRELDEVCALVRTKRLVTLTGPGGTGKTRLAIETARTVLDEYGDGVWFVALDVVREASLVIPTIAATLAVPEEPGRPIGAVLAERLAGRRSLLVLDNLEQVIDAASDIGALLRAATGLTVLASSREPLAIAGESVYPVPPLSVPDEPGRPTAAQILGLDAIELFLERAKSVRPDFALTDDNAPTLAAISRRLDGLPLALELAAARSNLLSPEQILGRLDHRLTLLASSRRDLPERQRTLRGAIDWSHDLLSEPERALFRRFSVFSGGADFEAMAAVVDPLGDLGVDPLDLASALVDRSLLSSVADGRANRLAMLETIREYAAERLASAGEEQLVRDRHAAQFRRLAEASRGVLTDPRRDEILDRLDAELPNIRAALRWSIEGGDLDIGFAIATSLEDYWHTRSHLGEARAALAALLEAGADRPPTTLSAFGLIVAAGLAAWHADFAAASALGTEAVRLAEELADPRLLMEAQGRAGWAAVASAPSVARDHFTRALEFARRDGDDRALRGIMGGLSVALLNLGELDEALSVATETIERSERAGDTYNASYARRDCPGDVSAP